MRFYEKLTRRTTPLILRGKSFHKRQIAMRKKFLKVSVLLKGTIATSVRMPTFLSHVSSWTNVSQEILETDESGLMSCQHYLKVVVNIYKVSLISNQYQLL